MEFSTTCSEKVLAATEMEFSNCDMATLLVPTNFTCPVEV